MTPATPDPDDDTILHVGAGGLDGAFWAYFAAHYWEQKSCVIRGAGLFDPADVERMVFAALGSSSGISGPRKHTFRLYLDDQKIDRAEK